MGCTHFDYGDRISIYGRSDAAWISPHCHYNASSLAQGCVPLSLHYSVYIIYYSWLT